MFFNEAEDLGVDAQPAQEEREDDDTVTVPAHKRAKRGRKPLDPALPREVVRHELPEAERVCPHDGAALQEIGVEASEQLDIIPQQVRVVRHERVKYACPCCDAGLRLAAKPEQVIPKGLFSELLLAWVITSKYLDGLPLYRQAALLARFGGSDISRNTMAASVVRVGQAVQPVIKLLRDLVLEAPLIYGDETHIQVLKEAGKAAQSKSFMWAQMAEGSGPEGTGPPIRLFASVLKFATCGRWEALAWTRRPPFGWQCYWAMNRLKLLQLVGASVEFPYVPTERGFGPKAASDMAERCHWKVA